MFVLDISKYKQILLSGEYNFKELALSAFNYQFKENKIYNDFCNHLGISPSMVREIEQIPFMPIEFFKNHVIKSGKSKTETVFESSGTTGAITSKHEVCDLSFYLKHSYRLFTENYKNTESVALFFLLPSYLERNNSSLVAMADFLLKNNTNSLSGFFLDDFNDLQSRLLKAMDENQEVILLGVTFGLLDFVDFLKGSISYEKLTVIETGGMKGRKKEMTRDESHNYILNKFKLKAIHSEYGMTELLSQSYSNGDGIFKANKAFKLLVRDIQDPLDVKQKGKGGLNIIDLANIESCCFLATQDQGELLNKEEYKITGRIDHSDIRGCNLMAL